MRRVLLTVALAAFLAAVAAWPVLGIPSRLAWPPLTALALAASLVVLRETRGPRVTLQVLLAGLGFGLLLPLLAVNLTAVYGFGEAAGWRVAGVPPGAVLAWTAFLCLALAASDQLRWMAASRTGVRPGPWVTGLVLALLECLWDPALLAEGVLWSKVPAFGSYALGFVPGFPLFHALLGWLLGALADRMNAAGPQPLSRAPLAATWLAGAGLAVLGISSLSPPPSLALPAWKLWLLDVGASTAVDALVLVTFLHFLPRLLPRRRAPVLFTTCTAPEPPHAGGDFPLDFYSSRLMRGQGVWTGECEAPYLGALLIAANLSRDCTVLEYPTLDELEEELRETRPEVVGIGFTNVARPRVMEMCRLVRRVHPAAMIVLGGHGVVCVPGRDGLDESFEGLYDEVCQGEGVTWMRELLGEPEGVAPSLDVPYQEFYPMGIRLVPKRMAPLVAGFGCNKRCHFCSTSAFFGGHNIRLASAEMLAAQAKEVLRRDPEVVSMAILDEDYLEDAARAREVARILREDPEVDFSRVHFSVFASIDSLRAFTPAELQSLGFSYMWVGVESKFTPLKKCDHEDVAGFLQELADHGICVTLSWVLGFDFQTPENLAEDLEWYVSLPSVTAQVSLLGPIPGTALHRQLEREGRLSREGWETLNLYQECMTYQNFAPGELEPWVPRAYDALYRRKGPSILRMAENWLRGYRTLKAHDDPALAPRVEALGRTAREVAPVLQAMTEVGEEPEHRQRARRWLSELDEAGLAPRFTTPLEAGVLTQLLRAAQFFHRRLGLPARQPRTRRTCYRGGRRRGAS